MKIGLFEEQYLALVLEMRKKELTEKNFWELMDKVEPLYKNVDPQNYQCLREHLGILSRVLYSFSNYGFAFKLWIPVIDATFDFMIEFLENSEVRLADLPGYPRWQKFVDDNEKRIEDLKGDPEFFRERMGF